MPKNPAVELRRLQMEQMDAPVSTDEVDHHPAGNEETNVTTLQETIVPTIESTNDRTNQRTIERPHKRTKLSAKEPTNVETSSVSSEREERVDKALTLAAEDEIVVVTVRVSARLNEYMDRYVERVNRVNPRRKYRKQDAVAEAFAAFFADHPMPPAPADEEL
jgi:hypothetical protein